MSDFLLELRSEEIPARMQAGARADLERLFRGAMKDAGVAVGDVTVWSTPRRLALIARDLPEATEAVREETKGPATSAPEQALEGFLRKVGLTKDRLEVRDIKGKDTYFAVVEKPGRAVKEVLAEAIPAIIRAFPWPKSIRWGAASISTESLRWVRPLSGIVAILGEDLVECEIEGTGGLPGKVGTGLSSGNPTDNIRSGYATKGHRFHHPDEITIGSAHDYADKLRACHVLVDHEERQDLIRTKAAEAASAAGLSLVEDEGLVVENAGLTEWPVPLLGRFDEDYLEVPPEVIQLTARTNQKYFVCEKDGKLANAFICTANIEAADGGAAIVAGNRKVLAARLSDARFFWDQDRKKTLEEHAEGLKRITFHDKLGTVADKAERVAKLARWLVEEGIVGSISRHSREGGNPDNGDGESNSGQMDPRLRGGDEVVYSKEELANLAEQAALLCKADLVTEMVGEFPELQGLMGGYYARAEGLSDAVADAIRDHYKPVGQGDEVPTAPVTVAVSLADKLDTLVGFFAAKMPPTGSKDPFALRRAELAKESLTEVNGLRYSHDRVVIHVLDLLAPKDDEGERWIWGQKALNEKERLKYDLEKAGIAHSPQTIVDELETVTSLRMFFADRLKVQQKEAGVRHDLIDAVFALGGEDDLVRLLARVSALQDFVGTEDGANLLIAYKRAANILKKEGFEGDGSEVSLSYTPEEAEKVLMDALNAAGPKAAAAVEAEDFAAAMAALASLRGPIDTFFDTVTVNDPDEEKRAARLALLDRFRVAVHNVADFSKIEG